MTPAETSPGLAVRRLRLAGPLPVLL